MPIGMKGKKKKKKLKNRLKKLLASKWSLADIATSMIRDLKTSKNKQTKNRRKKTSGREKDQKIRIIKLLQTNEKLKV